IIVVWKMSFSRNQLVEFIIDVTEQIGFDGGEIKKALASLKDDRLEELTKKCFGMKIRNDNEQNEPMQKELRPDV
ncbi:unnamed protein product, partial [Didymodactylos carnosus]